MNKKNNIDQFFSKTIKDITKENPEWLLPSDDIWDAAKVHFPKKENKDRKVFIILLFSLFGLIVSEYFIQTLKTKTNTVIDQNIITQQNTNLEEAEERLINSNSSPEDIESASVVIKDVSNSKVESKPVSVTENKSDTKKSIYLTSSVDQTEKHYLKYKNTIESSILNPMEKEAIEVEQNPVTIKNKIIGGDKVLVNSPVDKLVDRKVSITPLLASSTKSILTNNGPAFLPGIVTLIPSLSRPHYEVGISHRQLLLNLSTEFDSPENTKDKIAVKQSYFNINADFRKWIAPNWSLQSGFWYSQFEIDLEFSVFEELDREARDFFAAQLAEFSFRSLEENNDRFSSLVFKDGSTLNIGDSINLQSSLTIGLTVYQLPFMLDRHFKKGNWEFVLGGGFTIDYVIAKQSPFDLNVFKDGILVNEPFRTNEAVEQDFDCSIYANAGIRYRLGHNVYLGLASRMMISEPIFSGVELGIYYRL